MRIDVVQAVDEAVPIDEVVQSAGVYQVIMLRDWEKA